MATTVGSILHGAYGDYYEQMVGLRLYKRHHPDDRLILFFETESRRKELGVFDTSFADEVHLARSIPDVPVDRFFQFQIRDRELRTGVIDKLPGDIRAKFDLRTLNKPWIWVRRAWREDPALCDIGLSPTGRNLLPQCMADNGVGMDLYNNRMTVAFLWRTRRPTGYISSAGQPSEEQLWASKSALLQHFIDRCGATVLVAGMNLKVDDTNRERTDCKFSDRTLSVTGDCRYLKGLSWGLELEIVRRCSLCFVMASGFSEALWLKRMGKNIVLVDPPRQYLLKLAYNRMPLFSVLRPSNWRYYWFRSHSADAVLKYARARCDTTGGGGDW